MKVLGHSGSNDGKTSDSLVVQVSGDEWGILRRLSGVPYDKASVRIGTVYDLSQGVALLEAYIGLQAVRKEMNGLHAKWTKFVQSMDATLGEKG